jgi:hypothetical protein
MSPAASPSESDLIRFSTGVAAGVKRPGRREKVKRMARMAARDRFIGTSF